VSPAEFRETLADPTLDGVAGLLERLEGWAIARRMRFAPRRELLLIGDELVTNVAKYSEGVSELRVEARCEATGSVVFVVEDDGAPFDPFAQEEPATDQPLEDRTPGGLGLFLVRQLAARVDYRRAEGRNRVEVVVASH
jgi:anti-sigma regulatory factor (Ser/Thr protein kinase)